MIKMDTYNMSILSQAQLDKDNIAYKSVSVFLIDDLKSVRTFNIQVETHYSKFWMEALVFWNDKDADDLACLYLINGNKKNVYHGRELKQFLMEAKLKK